MCVHERAGESPECGRLGEASARPDGQAVLGGRCDMRATCASNHRCATAARPLYQKPVTQRKRVDDDDDLCTHALAMDSGRFSPNPVRQVWATGAAPQT